MRITVNNSDLDLLGWGVNAEFNISEEADTNEALEAFLRAMMLEGYSGKSLAMSMITWLDESGIDIDALRQELCWYAKDKDEPIGGQISMFDGE